MSIFQQDKGQSLLKEKLNIIYKKLTIPKFKYNIINLIKQYI